ncbi:hypothetical protein LTR17_017338 [Elasticomyces elasticus]|nr:hypothetical protein LTR17_017338 [Elasticomyces elasticus]
MTFMMSGTSAVKHRRASDSDPDDEEHATKKSLTASAANMIASSSYVAEPGPTTQPLNTATLNDNHGKQTTTQHEDHDPQHEQPQPTEPEDRTGTGDFRHDMAYRHCTIDTQDKRKDAIERIRFYTGANDPYEFLPSHLRNELKLPTNPRDASTKLMSMIASLCELVRQDRERAWRLVDEAIAARSHDSEALFCAQDLTLALRRGAEEDGEARQRLREETSDSANVDENDSSSSPQGSTKKDEVRDPEQQHATLPLDTDPRADRGLGSWHVPSTRVRGNSLDIRRLSATFESTKLEDTIPGPDPHLLDLQFEEAEADHRMKRIKIDRYIARRIMEARQQYITTHTPPQIDTTTTPASMSQSPAPSGRDKKRAHDERYSAVRQGRQLQAKLVKNHELLHDFDLKKPLTACRIVVNEAGDSNFVATNHQTRAIIDKQSTVWHYARQGRDARILKLKKESKQWDRTWPTVYEQHMDRFLTDKDSSVLEDKPTSKRKGEQDADEESTESLPKKTARKEAKAASISDFSTSELLEELFGRRKTSEFTTAVRDSAVEDLFICSFTRVSDKEYVRLMAEKVEEMRRSTRRG